MDPARVVSSRGQGSECKGPEEEVSLACSTNTKENSVAIAVLSGRGLHLTSTHMRPVAALWTLSNPLSCTRSPPGAPGTPGLVSERLSQGPGQASHSH